MNPKTNRTLIHIHSYIPELPLVRVSVFANPYGSMMNLPTVQLFLNLRQTFKQTGNEMKLNEISAL
jgi:hypothetical protein